MQDSHIQTEYNNDFKWLGYVFFIWTLISYINVKCLPTLITKDAILHTHCNNPFHLLVNMCRHNCIILPFCPHTEPSCQTPQLKPLKPISGNVSLKNVIKSIPVANLGGGALGHVPFG